MSSGKPSPTPCTGNMRPISPESGAAHVLATVDKLASRVVRPGGPGQAADRRLYTRHGYRPVPAFSAGPYAECWYAKTLR